MYSHRCWRTVFLFIRLHLFGDYLDFGTGDALTARRTHWVFADRQMPNSGRGEIKEYVRRKIRGNADPGTRMDPSSDRSSRVGCRGRALFWLECVGEAGRDAASRRAQVEDNGTSRAARYGIPKGSHRAR